MIIIDRRPTSSTGDKIINIRSIESSNPERRNRNGLATEGSVEVQQLSHDDLQSSKPSNETRKVIYSQQNRLWKAGDEGIANPEAKFKFKLDAKEEKNPKKKKKVKGLGSGYQAMSIRVLMPSDMRKSLTTACLISRDKPPQIRNASQTKDLYMK